MNATVIIMDEPTSALSNAEVDELFRITRDLRSQGKSIVYISHRLQELQHIVDTVTIMRDREIYHRRQVLGFYHGHTNREHGRP